MSHSMNHRTNHGTNHSMNRHLAFAGLGRHARVVVSATVWLLAALCATPAAHADDGQDLLQAAAMNRPRMVQALLAKGADVNVRNARGQTPLILALLESAPEAAATLMLAPKLEVNARNLSGESALMMACLRGNLSVAETLIERGAQVQTEGWTPLHYAASGENAALVPLLLAHGAQLESRSPTGNTALMMAARYGAESVFKALCDAGADPQARNPAGQNVADIARSAGRDYLAERLAGSGCPAPGRVR